MPVAQRYSEATDQPQIEQVPLSHLSIEVGHFYLKDIARDIDKVRAEFRRIVPLVRAFIESAKVQYGNDVRVSTCYLIDDYFQPDTSPSDILGKLLAAAEEAGLGIDYLARESGCHQISRFDRGESRGEPIPVAEMVAARIVAEPAPPDNGSRPPTAESGWLCNGRRSSDHDHDQVQAMRNRTYRPPEEFGRREHSLFLDVELWSNRTAETRWSCMFLAAVWHLLRLGMLRYNGAAVVDPQPQHGETWPRRWDEVPPVIQLNPAAQPFAAYRTLSMLPKSYIGIEHAVRVVLDHLDLDDAVLAQIIDRANAEGVSVSRKISDRLSHLLLDGA
ncbi:SCO2522 family protein [Nocardia sp. NPDC005366]|uniref:SCO2522 family protein n=1 Tax=Nocardia sp. NPDC005366 TaxID=3156878 RepID=UPI0033BB53E1